MQIVHGLRWPVCLVDCTGEAYRIMASCLVNRSFLCRSMMVRAQVHQCALYLLGQCWIDVGFDKAAWTSATYQYYTALTSMQVVTALSSWKKPRRRLAALLLKKPYCSILLRPGGSGAALTQGSTLKIARCALHHLLSMR